MADLDEYAMAKLAREMAMAIRNYKDIFADFGITEEDYYEIAQERRSTSGPRSSSHWNGTAPSRPTTGSRSPAQPEPNKDCWRSPERMLDPNEPFPGVLDRLQAAVPERRHRRPQETNKSQANGS